jgi:hypothetical protein
MADHIFYFVKLGATSHYITFRKNMSEKVKMYDGFRIIQRI